jgi:hypothetical protein
MKSPIIAVIAVAILISAAACTPPAQHTVAQYRADTPLRRQVLGKCLNDPGTLAATPDCVNAREAERLESLGSLREQPPLGLDSKGRR